MFIVAGTSAVTACVSVATALVSYVWIMKMPIVMAFMVYQTLGIFWGFFWGDWTSKFTPRFGPLPCL